MKDCGWDAGGRIEWGGDGAGEGGYLLIFKWNSGVGRGRVSLWRVWSREG